MKQNSLIVITTLVVSLLFGTLLITPTLVNGDNENDTIEDTNLNRDVMPDNVTPPNEPSPAPLVSFGIIFRQGFQIQPKENYYAQTGSNVRIMPKLIKRSTFYDSTSFEWFEYNPGSKNSWNKMKHEEQSYIDITSDKPTTKYYQLTAKIGWMNSYNSNMAAVHFSEKPVDATKINVSIDNDYLFLDKNFNNENAIATAKPDPIDATGKVTFTSENQELVIVDEDTGEIKLPGTRKSGTTNIVATISNSNNQKVVGKAPMTVGNILTGPSKIYVGKPATFKINGNFDTSKYQIDWYKKKGNVKTLIELNGNKELKTTMKNIEDDGAELYVNITKRGTNSPVETDSIKLEVRDIRPIFKVNQYISKYHNNLLLAQLNKQINGLPAGYDLMHALIITDTSKDPNISWRMGTIYVPISKNEEVTSIEIQNGFQNYKVEEINGKKTVIIPDFGLKHISGVEIKIRTKVSNKITEESFEYTPSFVATDVAGNEFIVRFPKNTATFQMPEEPEETPDPDNSTNNLEEKIKIDPAHINFGKHPKSSNQEIHMVKKQDKEEMVKITDKRDEFFPIKLSVQSEGPFHKKEDESSQAPITFRFITKEGNEVNLRDNTVIKRTKDGQPLESIKWNEFEGLKIYVKHNQFDDGNYTTSLKWTVSNAP
ncbi:WxL domain-containing protein [Companilactobacillus mishanensis]|uniref:WxL domain-containing protein n=1 Tax=Companilactobacillus mishanensis TaxID=2486008 RepID=A0A5P0ZGD1_9LACO|nr:WxL domain-containing protein [Companilactobacillus mishanensis]MQS52094.1 hypothetical protein [Companilactobacillus mishanensis]